MLQHFSHVHKNAMLKYRIRSYIATDKVQLFGPTMSSNSTNDQIIVNNLRSSFRVRPRVPYPEFAGTLLD
jgi:hypothetical protein